MYNVNNRVIDDYIQILEHTTKEKYTKFKNGLKLVWKRLR